MNTLFYKLKSYTLTFIVLAIISLKLSAFKLAPPTNAPSMSDCDICSSIVEGFTEPP